MISARDFIDGPWRGVPVLGDCLPVTAAVVVEAEAEAVAAGLVA